MQAPPARVGSGADHSRPAHNQLVSTHHPPTRRSSAAWVIMTTRIGKSLLHLNVFYFLKTNVLLVLNITI